MLWLCYGVGYNICYDEKILCVILMACKKYMVLE